MSVQFNFEGKRALVTGAGQGLGRAISKALYSAKAVTYAVDISRPQLDSLAAECPGMHTLHVDLTNWDTAKKTMETAGRIDLLVNNAGINVLQPFTDVDQKSFEKIFKINVEAALNVSQVVTKTLLTHNAPGSIVNISSQASMRALKDHTAYCASKAALDQMMKMMAFELGPNQIRTNNVNPTVVMTDLGRAAWSDPARGGPMKARIPLGKFAEEADIVSAVLFLLSDAAAMINGVCLSVDGGFTCA